MENQDYFNVKKVKSTPFKCVLILLAIVSALPIISAVMGINNLFLKNAPTWFFVISILISALSWVAIIGIYMLKKIAVYALAILILGQYFWYLSAYNLEFFDSLVALFVFIGFGLFEIIPRWKFFN